MKRLLFLLALAAPGFAQCAITVIPGTQVISASRTVINTNFASLNTCKPQRFSGSTLPGNITGSLRGDFYQNTTAGDTYQCFAAGPCTAVAAGNWVKLNGTGGGTGTVTVVSSGNLTSTALMTGGGAQTSQTPSATATMDTSGNISTPGTIQTGVGSSNPGYLQLNRTTVSALPACNSGAEGARMSVNDATATTFASIVVGGGSNHVPVYCNGTNWVIG